MEYRTSYYSRFKKIDKRLERKDNRYITIFGETKSVIQWSLDESCEVCYSTLSRRINEGWNLEKVLTR